MKECPFAYYSNQLNYECEDALSQRIVFFPVLITMGVIIVVVLVGKIFATETAFVTATTALITPLELAVWIYLFVLLLSQIKEPDVDCTVPSVLLGLAFSLFAIISLVFFFINRRKMVQDDYVVQWAVNNINYATVQAVTGASIVLGAKFQRIIYSRLFGALALSMAYKNRSNAFVPATVMTVCVICLCEVVAIAASWLLIQNKVMKDQVFYTSVECLIISLICIVFSAVDIYKADTYFEET